MCKNNQPKEIHVASVIASAPGIQFIQSKRPDVKIWIGAIDNSLNSKSHIVPGLGDAGDLSFDQNYKAHLYSIKQEQCLNRIML